MDNQKTLFLAGADGYLGMNAISYFHNLGVQIFATCHTENNREKTMDFLPREIQQSIQIEITDLSNPSQVQECVNKANQQNRSIDYLLNAAGGFRWIKTIDSSLEDMDFLFRANFQSCWLLAKFILPKMIAKNFGRVAFISAAPTIDGIGPGMGLYSASKAAINALVEGISKEVKSNNININAILPTIIDTPQNRIDMPDENFNNWVSAEAILDTCSYLFSPTANALHGALLKVGNRV